MSNRPEMRWPTTEIEQRKRLCAAATREEMGLAARDENEVTCGHAKRPTVLQSQTSRTPAQIMEHCIRKLGQRQTPGPAELVVEEHGSLQANAVKHVGENVHAY